MKQSVLLSITLSFVLLLFSQNSYAVRWFEVELIAFEQKPNETLKEDFSLELESLPQSNILDLMSDGFNLAGQNACLEGNNQLENDTAFIQSLTQSSQSQLCDSELDYVSLYENLPLSPAAEEKEHMQYIYLLSESQFKFQSVLNKLKRKGLKPLLHTGWRFPEQSKKRAPFIKVFGGERYEQPSSFKMTNSMDFQSLLDPSKLVTESKEADHWQLEGLIKIHVRHYLYVTSLLDMKYTLESGEHEQARLSQYTRVYSGDIHYLDHPKLGVIFQIRKYKH